MVSTLDISVKKVEKSRLPEVDFNNISFGKEYTDHMFLANYANGEWGNFRIEPYGDIKVSPANPTIHYGQSVFEGLKGYKAEDGSTLLFRAMDNFKRMNISAERMCMPQLPEQIYLDGLSELIALDRPWVPDFKDTSIYVRPFMFATDEYIGIRPSDNYTFMIIMCPVGAYYSQPVKVKVETHYTRSIAGGIGYAKTAGNYAAALYPAKLAQEKGYDQLIWTDGKNHEFIEESGTMNVMFVINDTLITAPTSDSILHGITRDCVLTLARDWGMKVEERPISVKEVIAAAKDGSLQEAFGAGTAATIAHIELIGYDGSDYKLSAIESRKFSNKVLEELTAIKLGKAEDKFNWNLKV